MSRLYTARWEVSKHAPRYAPTRWYLVRRPVAGGGQGIGEYRTFREAVTTARSMMGTFDSVVLVKDLSAA